MRGSRRIEGRGSEGLESRGLRDGEARRIEGSGGRENKELESSCLKGNKGLRGSEGN